MRFYGQISGPDGFSVDPEKQWPVMGRYDPLMGIIWGSIWAYFYKQANI